MDLQTSLIYFINDGVLAGKSPTTLKCYQYNTKLFFDYIRNNFLPMELGSCSRETLEHFMIYGLKIKKWSRIYHWSVYQKLHVYFNWCVKKELLEVNPLKEIPKPKMPQLLPKSLNEQEVITLLRTVSNMKTCFHFTTLRNRALVACFIFTGLRKNEMINLKIEDVDLDNGFIQVERGKGGKRREVPIEELTLKPLLLEYTQYKIRLGKISEWFFNGTFNGRNLDNKIAVSTVDRLFTKLSKLTNKRVSAHKLRHSFATLLLDKTGDIYTLKELMGHSNIATTCVYLSSTRRKKVEVINQLRLE